MSSAAQLVMALSLFVVGVAAGIKWHAGQDAIAARAADDARQSDARQQRQLNDQAGGKHTATLARINNQLGNARETIAQLSGRDCLDAGTVRVLNDIGGEPVRAAAGQPAGAPTAAASDRDVADQIAACRSRYAEVASQLNQILDIEDRRQGRVQTRAPVEEGAPPL